jgi:hypothetical protein
MEKRCISRTEILRNTLFHIQVKQCQYIDDFPEAVATILDTAVEKRRIKDYKQVKNRLYRIKTNFFQINRGKTKKKDFFEGLYRRIKNKV